MAERKMISVDRSMLPPNNEKKQERREDRDRETLESVVKNGTVSQAKPSIGRRIRNLFISEDVGDVKSWLLYDVTIPFMKDTLLDMIEMAFFGSTRGSRRRGSIGKSYGGGQTNYRASYSPKDDRRDRDRGRRDSSKVDYQDIVLSDRYDAKNVVETLYERIEKYGNATVADLLELTGHSSTYPDTCYGWESPTQIGVRRVSDGYLIEVSRAEAID